MPLLVPLTLLPAAVSGTLLLALNDPSLRILIAFALALVILFLAGLVGLAILILWLRQKHQDFQKAFDTVVALLWFIWCFILIYFWLGRKFLKSWIPHLVLAAFLAAGLFTLVDLLVQISDQSSSQTQPLLAAHADLDHVLEDMKSALKSIASHSTILIILLFVEAVIFYHHISHHRHRSREAKTLVAIGQLFPPLSAFTATVSTTDNFLVQEEAKRKFLREFAAVFTTVFRMWNRRKINVCIMELPTGQEQLRVSYESSEGKDFNNNFTLKLGTGAAGKCFDKKEIVYLPNVGYQHGLLVRDDSYSVVTSVYLKGTDGFMSILNVPIVTFEVPNRVVADPSNVVLASKKVNSADGDAADMENSKSKCLGVLVMSSVQKNAFSDFDIVIGRLGATILGLMYNQEFEEET